MNGSRASHVESALRKVRNCPICRPFARTGHCKLDKVGHRSLCPPRNGTGVVLLEAGMCRVGLKEI